MGKPPKVRKTRPLGDVVQHILSTIEQIEPFIAGLDENGYLADEKTQRAVERCLEIVSEASRDVPLPIKSEHPEIDWRRMADGGCWQRLSACLPFGEFCRRLEDGPHRPATTQGRHREHSRASL